MVASKKKPVISGVSIVISFVDDVYGWTASCTPVWGLDNTDCWKSNIYREVPNFKGVTLEEKNFADVDSIKTIIIEANNPLIPSDQILRLANFVSANLPNKHKIYIMWPDRLYEAVRDDFSPQKVVRSFDEVALTRTAYTITVKQEKLHNGLYLQCHVSKNKGVCPDGESHLRIVRTSRKIYRNVPVVIDRATQGEVADCTMLRIANVVVAWRGGGQGVAVRLVSGDYEVVRNNGQPYFRFGHSIPSCPLAQQKVAQELKDHAHQWNAQ